MFKKKQLYIDVSDNYIKYAVIKNKNLSVEQAYQIPIVHNIDNDALQLRKKFRKYRIKNKNVSIVLSTSAVITRMIELPKIKKKDLNDLILNNLEQYFSIVHDDYLFDYSILKEVDNMYSILLVAVLKKEIDYIINICNKLKLKINCIDVYANSIMNLFQKNNNDVGFIDIREEEVHFVSISDEKLFMYSHFDPNEYDSFSYQSYDDNFPQKMNNIITNVLGYINFFSIKHYGKSLSEVFVNGDDISSISKIINDNTGIQTSEQMPFGFFKNPKKLNLNGFYSLIGLSYKYKKIKDINFYLPNQVTKSKKNKFTLYIILVSLILASVFFYFFVYPFIQHYENNKKINELKINLQSLNEIKSLLSERDDLQRKYNEKQLSIKKYNTSVFDIMKLMNIVEANKPSNVDISNLTLDNSGKITIDYKVDNLNDILSLINILNSLNLFEDIPLELIQLNDKTQNISFSLKMKEAAIKNFYKVNKE